MATAKEKELEARIKQLEQALSQFVPVPRAEPHDPRDRPDYIEPGSPEHAQFKGLVILDDPEDADGRTVYTSRQTDRMYCLEDERAALTHCPGMSREDAVYTVLREKVGEFESGDAVIPDNAPAMWTPTPGVY